MSKQQVRIYGYGEENDLHIILDIIESKQKEFINNELEDNGQEFLKEELEKYEYDIDKISRTLISITSLN